MLKISNLSKSYNRGAIKAVDHLNLHLTSPRPRRGEDS